MESADKRPHHLFCDILNSLRGIFDDAFESTYQHFQRTMLCLNNERIEMEITFQIVRQTDFNHDESMPNSTSSSDSVEVAARMSEESSDIISNLFESYENITLINRESFVGHVLNTDGSKSPVQITAKFSKALMREN